MHSTKPGNHLKLQTEVSRILKNEFQKFIVPIFLNFIIAGKNKVLVEIGTDCILPYNAAITKCPTAIAK